MKREKKKSAFFPISKNRAKGKNWCVCVCGGETEREREKEKKERSLKCERVVVTYRNANIWVLRELVGTGKSCRTRSDDDHVGVGVLVEILEVPRGHFPADLALLDRLEGVSIEGTGVSPSTHLDARELARPPHGGCLWCRPRRRQELVALHNVHSR